MDYLVELDFSGPGFVAVPNSVVDNEALSADALAALVYLARLAGGRGSRIVRVCAIRKRFAWGERKWQGVFRNLRDVQALKYTYGRSDDGRSVVRSLVIGWPGTVVDPVTDEKAVTEETRPAKRRSGDRQKGGQVTDKKAVLKRDTQETAAAPAAPRRAKRAQAAASDVAQSARVAASVARVEAARAAENDQRDEVAVILDRLTDEQRLRVRQCDFVMIDGEVWQPGESRLTDLWRELQLQEARIARAGAA